VLWQFFNLIVKQAANNYRVIFCFVMKLRFESSR